jgi:hypothetical protein
VPAPLIGYNAGMKLQFSLAKLLAWVTVLAVPSNFQCVRTAHLASPSSGSLQLTLTHLARFTFTEVCHVEEASLGGCPFGSVFGHFAL